MSGPPESVHAINPFLLPRCEGVRPHPLCPWREPEHHGYYVAIGDSEDTFEKFTTRMTDVVNLQQRGHFVLVVGGKGCGKTSLVNRCVHWLERTLEPSEFRGVRVDLTVGGPLGRPQAAADRMKFVCERIRDDLEVGEQLVKAKDLEQLGTMTDQPGRFYPRLGKVLDDSAVLIVLLPRVYDLMDEVLAYAGMVGQRVILLTESSFLSRTDVLDAAEASAQPSPLLLEVGGLKPGDATAYVADRLDRSQGKGVFPMVADEVFEWLESKELKPYTIGSLQSVFSRLYGDLLENDPTYGNGRMVSPQEVVGAYIRYLRARTGIDDE